MKIYKPASIGNLHLRNRFIRSATHEGCGDIDGNPIGQMSEIYGKLVDGGVGAIITGYVGVNKQGRTLHNMPLFDSDERAEKYRVLLVHAQNKQVPIILQIAHGGGQAAARPQGVDLIAPSSYRFPLSTEKAREMTNQEIERVIEDFVQAIVRAKGVGYNGIQLHCAHGYLLSQFLSPRFNKRSDEWGGNLKNRFRIIGEILSRARKKVGSFTILTKLSAYSLDKRNLTLDDAIEIAKLLEISGCDGIEVSCGASTDGFSTSRCSRLPIHACLKLVSKVRESHILKRTFLSILMPFMVPCPKPLHDYNIEAGNTIKQHVGIPVIVVGGIRKRQTMEQVIEDKQADFVSLSRPFIIEPNLVRRFEEKKQQESRCIDCSYCLVGCLEHPVKCYYGKISS